MHISSLSARHVWSNIVLILNAGIIFRVDVCSLPRRKQNALEMTAISD